MAARATRAGIAVVFTDSIESVVGRTAVVNVAAAAYESSGAEPRAVGLGGLFLLDDGDEAEGEIVVHGHGLGIDIEAVVRGARS